MKFYGVKIAEGASVANLVVETGAVFPFGPNNPPDKGEMFYKTGSGEGLYVYDGTTWESIGALSLDPELEALGSVTSAADTVPYFTGSGTASVASFTPFGRQLVDDINQAEGRSTLGLGTAATADLGTFGGVVPLLNGANTWSANQTFSGAIVYGGITQASVQPATVNGRFSRWNSTNSRYEQFDLLGAANTWAQEQTIARPGIYQVLTPQATIDSTVRAFRWSNDGTLTSPLQLERWNGTAWLPFLSFSFDGITIQNTGFISSRANSEQWLHVFGNSTGLENRGGIWRSGSGSGGGSTQYVGRDFLSAVSLSDDGSISISSATSIITFNGNNIWHAGNFDPSGKLNTTGGTMTGDLVINKGIPQIQLLSPSGATATGKGYRLFANISDANDFGLNIERWNGSAWTTAFRYENVAFTVDGFVATRFGAVGTQVFQRSMAWSNGVTRWAEVFEPDADLAYYCYNTAGSSPTRRLALDNAVGGNELFVGAFTMTYGGNTVWHAGNTLNIGTTASSARTALGLGTSATVNTGTSGSTIPLLNGNNTWSGTNTYTSGLTVLNGVLTRSVANGLTAAGTTQGTALALTSQINVISTVALNTGVLLGNAVGGTFVVINAGANPLNVYPISGARIDSLATNAAFVLPVGGKLEFIQTSATQYYTLNATFA